MTYSSIPGALVLLSSLLAFTSSNFVRIAYITVSNGVKPWQTVINGEQQYCTNVNQIDKSFHCRKKKHVHIFSCINDWYMDIKKEVLFGIYITIDMIWKSDDFCGLCRIHLAVHNCWTFSEFLKICYSTVDLSYIVPYSEKQYYIIKQ